jgi:hypothetical protein
LTSSSSAFVDCFFHCFQKSVSASVPLLVRIELTSGNIEPSKSFASFYETALVSKLVPLYHCMPLTRCHLFSGIFISSRSSPSKRASLVRMQLKVACKNVQKQLMQWPTFRSLSRASSSFRAPGSSPTATNWYDTTAHNFSFGRRKKIGS